mgnify:CR=1 FL=1
MRLRLPGTPLREESDPKRHGRQPRTVPVPRLFADSRPGYAGQPERAPDTAVGSSGTGGHPPPGPRAGRFPVLLRRGLQQECVGGLRRTGNDRGGLRLLPYGQVASTGSLVQPVQWSGEMHDEEPALAYYNYRYYNPKDGRWINRDPIAEQGGWNLYVFLGNSPQDKFDALGLIGIFGLLGGALIDYGFQVTANYIQGKEDPWTDIDWGSVTTLSLIHISEPTRPY